MAFGPYYASTKSKSQEADNQSVKLSNKGSLIDVVSDFSWTASPTKNAYEKIPFLYATELEQTCNSLIGSALYYLNNTAKSSEAKFITSYIDKILGGGSASDALGAFASKLTSITSSATDTSILTDYLKSYIGIYLTNTTGFKYCFPYFDGKPHNITSSWNDSMQVKPMYVDQLIQKGMEVIDSVAATLNVMQPGTYIERPKYYHYPTDGETITLTLPLLNTVTRLSNRIPYQQNYELLWILAFQNKPFRTSFTQITPPKLYTVTIPGMKFLPYAYISSMSVDFMGTRRLLDVTTPMGQVVNTSIPEAYMVNISFTSLLADTGNLMAAQGFNTKINVTSSGSSTSLFDRLFD